jgi:hypothetical protein
MTTVEITNALERLVSPLGDCLTPESARRLLSLKADDALQVRVEYLAQRHSKGLLSEAEQSEYSQYINYNTFVAILKSKARQLIASNSGG